MKTIMCVLLLMLLVLFVTGCSKPPNEHTSKAITKCIDKNWIPLYFDNGIQSKFSCLPPNKVGVH